MYELVAPLEALTFKLSIILLYKNYNENMNKI